jgi:hypothetical protein
MLASYRKAENLHIVKLEAKRLHRGGRNRRYIGKQRELVGLTADHDICTAGGAIIWVGLTYYVSTVLLQYSTCRWQ